MSDSAVRTARPVRSLPNQIGGDHYARLPVQPWDAMKAWFTPEQVAAHHIMTAIAYLARFNANAPGKGGLMDIEKAHHTLGEAIAVLKDPVSNANAPEAR